MITIKSVNPIRQMYYRFEVLKRSLQEWIQVH